MSGVCCFCIRCAPVFLCLRYVTKKRANGATVGNAGRGDRRRRPPGDGCGAGSACAGPSTGWWPAGWCAGCCSARPQRFCSGWTSRRPSRRRCCGTPRSTLRGACTGRLPKRSALRAPPTSSHPASTTCARTSGKWCTSWAPSS